MYGNLSVLVIPFGLFGHLLLLWDANKGNEIRVLFFFLASGNHSYGVLFLLFFCSSAQRKIEAIVRNYYTNWIMRIKQIRQFGPHEPVRAIISHLYVNQRCFSYLSNALRVFSCQHHNSGGQFLLQS